MKPSILSIDQRRSRTRQKRQVLNTRRRLGLLLPALLRFPELGIVSLEQLETLVLLELGNLDVLDQWTPYGTELTRAIAPEKIYLVCSHNLALSAWQAIVRSLILGSAVQVKVSATQAAPIREFIQSLPTSLRSLVTFSAKHSPTFLKAAAAVIVFGDDQTVQELRKRTTPHQRFLGYGHQTSLLWVGNPNRLSKELLKKIADDLCTYDQLGCLSPQAIYLAPGTNIGRFCESLAHELEQYPSPRRSPTEKLQIAELVRETRRRQSAFRTWVPADGHTGWTIFQHRFAGFSTGCGYRTVHVYQASPTSLRRALAPVKGRISTVGYAAPLEPPLEDLFLELGVKRFCPVGRCQHPSPYWHHDGRPQLGDLVTWADKE